MNDINKDPVRCVSKAAELVEDNFEKIAQTIDGLRLSLLEQASSGGPQVPLSVTIAARLAASSDRLRATNGEDVVDYAKDQLDHHSTVVSVVVAVVAAIAVQLTVAVVRKERRQRSQPNITLASI